MSTQAVISDPNPLPLKYELVDSKTLAQRWCLPESWIREYVRTRVQDSIPHFKMGKYVLFKWGSPELEAWLERHFVAGKASTRATERVQ